jgi:hypothetical protein
MNTQGRDFTRMIRVNSPLKKGSDPLESVEKQGKTGRPERVRPLFQRTVN